MALAARVGYGVPYGEVTADTERLSDLVFGRVPLWLELAYRVDPRWQVGMYLELAATSVSPGQCAAGYSCTGSGVRAGLAAHWHFRPGRRVDPWLATGLGLERLTTDVYHPGRRIEQRWTGIDLPLLEVGLDVALSDRVALGPFLSGSLSRFLTYAGTDSGATTRTAIADRSYHGWAELGLRVTVLP
jgi:hypothetical protein